MKTEECFKGVFEIFPYIPDEWCEIIMKQPRDLLKNATELRFRLGRSCSLTFGNRNYPVPEISVSEREMEKLVENIFQGAAYRFESQIKNGFIPLPGGHRVGLCGSYNIDSKGEVRIFDISSLNFRICRRIKGNADFLFPKLLCDGRFCSTLIVSEPCGGKTTLLAELVRVLSLKGYRIAVVDERGELASVFRGLPQNDLGDLVDVLDGYPKPYGMMIALRTLSPQVLACDEIGSFEETERMMEAMNAGVPILATAHARDEEELMNRPQIKRLLDVGAISKIVILKGASSPGKIRKVMTVNRYDDEDFWSSLDY